MRHALEVVAHQVRLQVLHAEVGLSLVVVRPWPAHENFIAVHGLLQVRAELFKQIVEAPGDAGVLARLSNLLSLHHFFEQRVEHLLPVLFAQGGRQQVDLLDAGLLECSLREQAFGVQLNALAVNVEEPQRWVRVVFGQR